MRISHRSRGGPKTAAVAPTISPRPAIAQAFGALNAELLTASPAGVVELRREGEGHFRRRVDPRPGRQRDRLLRRKKGLAASAVYWHD